MAYNVFISFDSKDTDLARDLSKRLEKAGLTVQTSTGKIDNPRDVDDRIENLKKADEVIFLISNNAIDGNKVLFDMGIANGLKKPLTPILVGLRPRELPAIVQGLEFIKYDELERYIGKLQKMVEIVSKPPVKAQSKPGEPSNAAA